jgi:hypothetical protein
MVHLHFHIARWIDLCTKLSTFCCAAEWVGPNLHFFFGDATTGNDFSDLGRIIDSVSTKQISDSYQDN